MLETQDLFLRLEMQWGVEHLLGIRDALGSISSTEKKYPNRRATSSYYRLL